MTDLAILIFWLAAAIFIGSFFSRVRLAFAKRGFRFRRVRYGSLGVALATALVIGLLNPAEPSLDPLTSFEIGQTYAVKRDGWVCTTWTALAQSNDASIEKINGFAERLAEERQIGCVSVANTADDSVKVLGKNKARALLRVRIISVHDWTDGRTGWVRAGNVDDAAATAAKIKARAASKARDEAIANELCAAGAANMEAVAKGRDKGVPEATTHAQQTGDIDNKIISLIYQTRQFSPQQERDAVAAVCNQTDGFIHGVGVSDDASVDKIDASIIHSIKRHLLANR